MRAPENVRSKIKRIKWAGHVAQLAKKGNAYRLLVGEPE
jgi:hypothetical protein